MRRPIVSCGVLLLIVTLLVSGCESTPVGTAQSPVPQSSYPMTITDHADRPVAIQQAPRTIVSLAPSNTEILYALGLGNKLIGVDDYSDYPPEAKSKERVGYSTPNMEKLVALSPDIIFATRIHLKEAVPEMVRRGLTVFVLQPGSLEAVLEGMRTVGKIVDRPQEADAVVAGLQKRIDEVETKTRAVSTRPRVFFELTAKLHTAGPGSFANDLIRQAGGTNIAADAKTTWPQLGQEALLAKDPEVIILSDHGVGETPEKVKARPGWSGVSAVKTGRIYDMNPDLTNRAGPRVVDGLELMAKAIHPELYK